MKKVFIFAVLLMVALPFVASAQGCSFTNGESLGTCMGQIYIWSLGGAAILAVLMVIVGGYLIMSARGNASQASKGREYLGSALIGVAILMGAFLLLNQINPDLTNFQINTCISTSCH